MISTRLSAKLDEHLIHAFVKLKISLWQKNTMNKVKGQTREYICIFIFMPYEELLQIGEKE